MRKRTVSSKPRVMAVALTAATLAATTTTKISSETAVAAAAAAAGSFTSSRYFSRPNNIVSSSTRHSATATNKSAPKDDKDSSKNNDEKVNNAQHKRTQSFDPVWAGTISPPCSSVKVHTIILGTHPSITSLAENQYFGHPLNTFWWIAGDCLGFRRASGVSDSTGKEYVLSKFLRYNTDKIIPYNEQLKTFTSKGFALWDVVQSCEREGSLDSAIKHEIPNDIQSFCNNHPTVKRIVLANGGTSSTIFNRHFKGWWESGELKPGRNEQSTKAFGKFAKKTNNFENGRIEVISAVAVSPAAAGFTYEEKREFWETFCFGPGLKDDLDSKKEKEIVS